MHLGEVEQHDPKASNEAREEWREWILCGSYNIAHYTRLSPTRGAGDLGMDDTSKEALEVMRATTLDYIGHSSDCIDELCAVLTRSYTGAAAGEVVEEDSAAGDEVQARMRRLERDLAKSEAARIRAEAEVARLRRT